MNGSWKAFVTGAMTIHPHNGIFFCSQQHSHIRSPVLPNFSSLHLFYLAVLACWPVTVRVSGYINVTVYGGIVIFAVVAYSLLFLFHRYDNGHSLVFGLLVCECHGQRYNF